MESQTTPKTTKSAVPKLERMLAYLYGRINYDLECKLDTLESELARDVREFEWYESKVEESSKLDSG